MLFDVGARPQNPHYAQKTPGIAPVIPETSLVESSHHGLDFELFVILLFELDGWDVSDGFEYPFVVKPVDPFEGSELDVFQVVPGAASIDNFCLVETDDRLGQRIVIGVANAPHGWLDAGLSQAFGVPDAKMLPATVAVVYEPLVARPCP